MSEQIRILLVDDYAAVRAGLRALIDLEPDMRVVGEADNAETAVDQAHFLQPDVILMDLVLPDFDGLTAIRAIQMENAGARILVLTNYAEDDRVREVMDSHVAGYLLKGSGTADIVNAIRDVHRGVIVVHPLVRRIWSRSA